MKKRIIAIFITIVSIIIIANLLSCGNDNNDNNDDTDTITNTPETTPFSASLDYADISGTVGYLTESNFQAENYTALKTSPTFENGDGSSYMVIDMTITTTVENDGGNSLDILTEISNRAVIRPNIERAPTSKIDQAFSNGASTVYTTYSILPNVGEEKAVYMIIELFPVSSGKTDVSLLVNGQTLCVTEATTNNTDLYYSINNDGASYTVTGVKNSSATSLTIPETLRDGLTVTHIDNEAFKNASNILSIELPNTIVDIGESAFYGCSSLESMTLPFVGGSATSDTFL